MQFRHVDTAAAYRRLLAAPDAAARTAIFRAELAAPFAGLARFFGQDDHAAAFGQWGMAPEQFAPERHAEQAAKLDALVGANAWGRAERALNVLEHAEMIMYHWATFYGPDHDWCNADPSKTIPRLRHPQRLRILAPGEKCVLRHNERRARQ